jgi:CBS-domain-containing membrane protein
MGAFIVAGLVFVATLFAAFMTALIAGGIEAPKSPGASPWLVLGGGAALSALIASTHWHWLPHIGW